MVKMIGGRSLMILNNNFISSHTSPICVKSLKKYTKSSYSIMLIDDFTRSFRIALSQSPYPKGYFYVHPANDLLESYLSFQDRWTDYDFDQFLCSIFHDLIINGKAYAEIITWKKRNEEDDTEEYIGLSIEPIHAKSAKRIGDQYYFKGMNQKGEAVSFMIDAKYTVYFDLKGLGLKRNSFRKLFKRLNSINIQNTTSLMLDKSIEKHYDFMEHIKKNEFKLLQYTRGLYWYGRNMRNQYLSESYRLYRDIHLKLLRKDILNYLLEQINDSLTEFKTEMGFVGTIVAKDLTSDYNAEFQRYYTGEINAEQLGKIIYRLI